ncbi:MAG: DUF3106 domain-containing protein [Stenotrophobium sp.]
MNTRIAGIALLLFGLIAALPAQAAVNWQDLSPAQQALLNSVEKSWAQLPPERQDKLAEGAARWAQMTPAQRQQAQQRLAWWNSQSPQQRAEILHQRAVFRAMTPAQQQKLLDSAKRYRSLPADQQQMLRQRFETLQAGGLAPPVTMPNSADVPVVAGSLAGSLPLPGSSGAVALPMH